MWYISCSVTQHRNNFDIQRTVHRDIHIYIYMYVYIYIYIYIMKANKMHC